MLRRNDEQFLLVTEPVVPWKEVHLAVIDTAWAAKRTQVHQTVDMHDDDYEVSFRIPREFVRLLALHQSVRHHMVEQYMEELRKGLHVLAERESKP